MRWNRKNREQWLPWFAWHLVTIHKDDSYITVWLETVERCLVSYGTDNVWHYREIRK